MIIIIFFENMVIDALLACLFNVHYLIFLSVVHKYAYFLLIYLEIGLSINHITFSRVQGGPKNKPLLSYQNLY